jgi:hypothetical protein
MAVSTAITTLNYKATTEASYAKLVDIISYPDMGASPSKLDTTDLTQPKYKTSILGLQEVPDLTFECNYDETAYATIADLEGDELFFELAFGAAGANGSITRKGQVSIFINGGGVDEVRKMTVTCSASTPIVVA